MRKTLFGFLVVLAFISSQNCTLKVSDYDNSIKFAYGNGTACKNLTILIDNDIPISGQLNLIANSVEHLILLGNPQRSLVPVPINFSNFLSVSVRNVIIDTSTQKMKALNFINSTSIVENSILRNNPSGGIDSGSPLYVSSCLFFNNSYAIRSNSLVEVQSSNFTKNNGVAINATYAVLINNTFTGNNAAYGGAVLVGTQLTSVNNLYTRNNATRGGAIYASKATLTNDTFVGNSATTDGGAIYIPSVGNSLAIAMNISNCIFTSNIAQSGGAIYSLTSMAVNHSYFESNRASGDWGGAIFANTTTDIYNSTFTANTALGSGGAFATPASVNMIQCRFYSNVLGFKGTVGDDLGGGAVYLFTTSNFYNNYFFNNTVDDRNGYGGALTCSKDCVINGSIFIFNHAVEGGAFYGDKNYVHTFDGCTLVNNSVSTMGGAISSSHFVLKNSYLGFNNATFGGGAYLGLECILENSTFEGNYAYFGAAVYGNNVLSRKGTKILRNKAKIGGGGFSTSGNVEITDSEFIGNEATNGGSVQMSSGSSFGVFNSTFRFNRASIKGGVFDVGSPSVVVLYGLEVESNYAGSSGGTLYMFGSFDQLIIDSWRVKGETSQGDGGSINLNVVSPTSEILVKNSSFEGCSSPLGGAFYVSGTIDTISFQSVSFHNNTATLSSGGALVLRMSANSVRLNNISFRSNVANYWGSCMIQHRNSVVQRWTMNNISVVSSKAGTGGSFTYQGTVSNFTIHNSFFENNEGVQGAVLELQGTISSALVQNSTFRNNTVQQIGGAILSTGSVEISIVNSNFEQNVAVSNGGAIYFGNTTVSSIEGSKFDDNSAANGGAMYVQISSLNSPVLSNCEFTSNRASNEGGAAKIAASNSNSLFAKDCKFEGNSATTGGGLSVSSLQSKKRQSSGISFDNLNFVNNNATDGGGLESVGDVQISNTHFGPNKATRGSGLSSRNGTVSVDNISMENSQIFLLNSKLVSVSAVDSALFTCSYKQHVENNNGSYSCVDDIVISTSNSPILVYKESNNVPLIVGIVVGVGGFLIILIVVAAVLVYRKRQRAKRQANAFSHIDFSGIKLGEAKKSVIDYDTINVHKEIGSGAFGVVFKGEWRGMSVAVKQIKSDQVTQVQLNDFVHEVTILKELRSHPNVVLFLGVTFPPQPLSLVTEFCEGGGLYEYLRSSPIDFEKKLEFIKGIARGMLHLHKEGVIHRDLAVRNILLSKHLEPKVSDFGLSREHADSESAATTNTTVGPLKWMSPEAILQRQYSIKSDVFSFGVVIWEILEVKDPWPQLTAVDAALRVAKEGARMPIPESANEALTEIMNGCWKQEAQDRFNFEQIIAILEPQSDSEPFNQMDYERKLGVSEYSNLNDTKSGAFYDSPVQEPSSKEELKDEDFEDKKRKESTVETQYAPFRPDSFIV